MRGDNHIFPINGRQIFFAAALDIILIKRSDFPDVRGEPPCVSNANVLAHHSRVFVLQNVAMIHEGIFAARRLREADQ